MNLSSDNPGPDVAIVAPGVSGRLGACAAKYDLIVIGGGIHGAALAREAASRGLSVVLLEQNDFGSGASANSLKIIHGGIRYLQTLDIGRLRQSVREQRALLRIAPHLVRPMRCVMPAYNRPGKDRLTLSLAARCYDLLSLDRNRGLDPDCRLGASGTLALEELRELAPALDLRGVTGALCWWDAQAVNSERLVLAFVMSARNLGASVFNYMQAGAPLVRNGRVHGLVAEDLLSGERAEIAGSVIMDCSSGGWVGMAGDAAAGGYVKAMNLVVRRSLASCAFGARPDRREAEQGGLLFHAPWREGAVIGTWYRSVVARSGDLSVSSAEIEAALGQFNSLLSSARLELADVVAVHLGLLPAASGGAPVPAGKFRIDDARNNGLDGLYRVMGVKYTTARDVARRALVAARRHLPASEADPGAVISDATPLYGGDIPNLGDFRQTRLRRYAARFGAETVTRLLYNYGTCMDAIIACADSRPELSQPIPGVPSSLRAELSYVLDHEMTQTLPDLICRRTDIGTFAAPAAETIRFCADVMARHRGWDSGTREAGITSLYGQRPVWLDSRRGAVQDAGTGSL